VPLALGELGLHLSGWPKLPGEPHVGGGGGQRAGCDRRSPRARGSAVHHDTGDTLARRRSGRHWVGRARAARQG
jgi:hypothetical protein